MLRTYVFLAASVLMVGLVLGLGAAIVVHHNPVDWVDRSVLNQAVAHRSPARTTAVAGITNLFGPAWVATWTVIAAVALWLYDKNLRRGAIVLATVVVAGAVGAVLKWCFDRPRPPFIAQAATYEASKSFPSGHVTGTTALVLALALVLTATSVPVVRILAICIAAAISVLAAATRLYLGVHWFSDVLAAIVLAAAVALVIPPAVAAGADRLQSRGPARLRPYFAAPPMPIATARHRQEETHHAPLTRKQ